MRNPVIIDEQAHRRADRIVAVGQGIDQRLAQGGFGQSRVRFGRNPLEVLRGLTVKPLALLNDAVHAQ